MRKIEIDFPCDVEFPPGFERILDALVDMVCKKYESKNPTRIMWPSECGFKPIYIPLTKDEERDRGPEFDESIYHIGVCEREDIHGSNPLNPDRDRIISERKKQRGHYGSKVWVG